MIDELEQLKRDTKIARTLLSLRVTLWAEHGALMRLPGGGFDTIDHRAEIAELDSVLSDMGICAGPPLAAPVASRTV